MAYVVLILLAMPEMLCVQRYMILKQQHSKYAKYVKHQRCKSNVLYVSFCPIFMCCVGQHHTLMA